MNIEIGTDPGQNKAARARLRDPGATGPDAMVLPAATPRPRSSRTVENSGAGRAHRMTLNRDWPGRAEVLRSFGGDLDLDVVDQIDAAHTTTDRTDS